MRIPTYERKENAEAHQIQKFQVSNQTPDTRLQVNADMFGGAQARAMGQAGHDLQRAGALGVRAAAEWEDTKAQAAMNAKAAEDAEALYGENGIFNLKGEAAVDAPVKLQKYMAESESKYAGQAGGSWGKAYFKQRVERQTQQLLPRAMQHATVEKNNFEVATYGAAARNAMDSAIKNAADPAVFASYAAEVLQNTTLMAQKKGLPPEAVENMRREVMSQTYMGVASGLLSSGDVKGAQGILGKGFLTGQDAVRLKGAIRTESKRLEAEARANAADARIGIMVSETDTMFKQFGSDVESGYMYIREKYKNDPRMRLEMESAFSGRVRMEEAAENKTKELRLKAIKDSSLDDIGKKDATPASVSKIVLESPPEIQAEVSRAARMRFPSQEVIVSDSEKLAEARDGIFTGEYKDEKEFRRLYMPYISSNELAALEQRVTKNRDKASDASLRSSFNTILRGYDIEGLASSANMTPTAYSKSAWDTFVAETYVQDFQTPQEKRQYMHDYLRRVSLAKHRSFFGISWDSQKEVPEFAARPLREDGYSEVIPEESRLSIAKKLEGAGKPPTEENIRKVWEYNTGGNKK